MEGRNPGLSKIRGIEGDSYLPGVIGRDSSNGLVYTLITPKLQKTLDLIASLDDLPPIQNRIYSLEDLYCYSGGRFVGVAKEGK